MSPWQVQGLVRRRSSEMHAFSVVRCAHHDTSRSGSPATWPILVWTAPKAEPEKGVGSSGLTEGVPGSRSGRVSRGWILRLGRRKSQYKDWLQGRCWRKGPNSLETSGMCPGLAVGVSHRQSSTGFSSPRFKGCPEGFTSSWRMPLDRK